MKAYVGLPNNGTQESMKNELMLLAYGNIGAKNVGVGKDNKGLEYKIYECDCVDDGFEELRVFAKGYRVGVCDSEYNWLWNEEAGELVIQAVEDWKLSTGLDEEESQESEEDGLDNAMDKLAGLASETTESNILVVRTSSYWTEEHNDAIVKLLNNLKGCTILGSEPFNETTQEGREYTVECSDDVKFILTDFADGDCFECYSK